MCFNNTDFFNIALQILNFFFLLQSKHVMVILSLSETVIWNKIMATTYSVFNVRGQILQTI